MTPCFCRRRDESLAEPSILSVAASRSDTPSTRDEISDPQNLSSGLATKVGGQDPRTSDCVFWSYSKHMFKANRQCACLHHSMEWCERHATVHPSYMLGPFSCSRTHGSGAASRFGPLGARPWPLCASDSHLRSVQFQQPLRSACLVRSQAAPHSAHNVNATAESAKRLTGIPADLLSWSPDATTRPCIPSRRSTKRPAKHLLAGICIRPVQSPLIGITIPTLIQQHRRCRCYSVTPLVDSTSLTDHPSTDMIWRSVALENIGTENIGSCRSTLKRGTS